MADITDGYSWWPKCPRKDCDLHIVRPGDAACHHPNCDHDGYGQLEQTDLPKNKYDIKETTMSQPIKRQQLWAVRLHDRDTDNDPHVATLMRAWEPEGPWHDVATGHPDNMWELLELNGLRDELARLRTICETNDIEWWNTDD